MHGLVEFLRREWIDLVFYGALAVIYAKSGARRNAERKRKALEGPAAEWPAQDGIAVCGVLPVAWKGFRLHLWVKPADGGWRAEWTRVFPLKEEADHYARALRGKTVAVHMEPYGSEKILRWDELKSAAPPFVSETQGRLTGTGYAGAQVFRAVAWSGLGLAAADTATFVRNPDFMWHGMCLCELSIALLIVGGLLLLPASMLRFRMASLPYPGSEWQFEGVSRSILLFLLAGAAMTWVGVFLFLGVSSTSPDWAFFALLSAPMFPLFWWSSVVATAAVRELRPIAPVVETVQVGSERLLGETNTRRNATASHGSCLLTSAAE